MNYICPVCGYSNLVRPPKNHTLCPSCGTEFDYDDATLSHEELRNEWLANGAPWFSDATPRPANWSAIEQLFAAGYGFRFTDESGHRDTTPTVFGHVTLSGRFWQPRHWLTMPGTPVENIRQVA